MDKKRAVGNGYIYIQVFPHQKKYVGQTINPIKRFEKYRICDGNNPHHTAALKKYGYDKLTIHMFEVPEFLLDSVEKALIKYYDTMDRTKGYNKKEGGANGRLSEETRLKLSMIQSDGRHAGENNAMFGKKHSELTKEIFRKINTGERNPFYGKTHTKESVEKFRRVGKDHHNFGNKASENTRLKMSIARTGQKRTQETKDKISAAKKGASHPKAKAVWAYGILYESCGVASDSLRFVHKRVGNFVKVWVHSKSHPEIFFA
ncbi:GIY-YIG catalytic domain-containing endonuclease [Paramecium bursaria Chlorella virus NE-JV-4]|nr:GIY-YIG catalytic domain-containing endonuclease [Paramecium bursaria Chlorella virus NE-JV-4]